jgi:hypothetical protein
MAMDLKRLGVTKRTWVLLGILAVLLGVLYVSWGSPAQPVAVKVAVPPGRQPVAAKPATEKRADSGGAVAVASSAPVGKDPFTVPAAYRAPLKKGVAKSDGQTGGAVPPQTGAPAPAVQMQPLPQLKGTVIGADGRAAILSDGSKSRAVRQGESFGEYTLVAVHRGWVVVEGPAGTVALRMGREG